MRTNNEISENKKIAKNGVKRENIEKERKAKDKELAKKEKIRNQNPDLKFEFKKPNLKIIPLKEST